MNEDDKESKLNECAGAIMETVRLGKFETKVVSSALQAAAKEFVFPPDFVERLNAAFKASEDLKTFSAQLVQRYLYEKCYEDGICIYSGRLAFNEASWSEQKVVDYAFETDASQDQLAS